MFPHSGILPKQITQAQQFVQKHPQFDGRGTTIAILDTGVDPGAPGLQTTSHGLPKITHLIDCTGSGDVLLKTVQVTKELKGHSGRTLVLPIQGEIKLGSKAASDLFPKPLRDRLSQERKTKFETEHQKLLTMEQSDDPIKKQELKNRSQVLEDLKKNYQDVDDIFDVVVYFDKVWRVLIDFDCTGDFTKIKPLASYELEHEYITVSQESMLNVSVNVYDDGNTLSIVTNAGSHGTHVAAIAAAHFPDNPEINGVAPGAQIISLKIGDTRLGSMETGTGLVRACIELARLKVDVANISYGEATALPNQGRIIELLQECINEHNVVVVSSGGNNGPALSTVGAPGGTASQVIGVGAYVTQDMMEAEYALAKNTPERPYTWSSRGPSPDGDLGVDIYCPGAAFTSVPQFNLKKSQLMNGTSMSSPNMAGCVSLLVSALRQSSIPYNPYLIRHVATVTAKSIKDPLGIGMMQVQDSWDYLLKSINDLSKSVFYDVKVGDKRGIYLRDQVVHRQWSTTVKPLFFKDARPETNPLKLQFEVKIRLEASHEWIQAPNYMIMTSEGRTFNVIVNPEDLPAGQHNGYINAFDAEKGTWLFKIPVTVLKPLELPEPVLSLKRLGFGPGDIKRHFVQVPANSNFMEINLSNVNRPTPATFFLHLIQLHPQSRYTLYENEKVVQLSTTGVDDRSSQKFYFPCIENTSLEICLAQFWSSPEHSTVDLDVKFHSINVSGHLSPVDGTVGNNSQLILSSFSRLDLSTPLRQEKVDFKLSFDKARKFLVPTEYKSSQLLSRDVLPNTRQLHELVLQYTLSLSEATTVEISSTFNKILYDSTVENYAVYVYDQFKRPVAFQDVYSKPLKLEQGDYTIRVQIVSHNFTLLQSFKGLVLNVDHTLAKPITPGLFRTVGDAMSSGEKIKSTNLTKGDKLVAFVGSIQSKDLLVGSLVLEPSKISYPCFALATPEPKKEEDLVTDKEEPKTKDQELLEQVRDLEISFLKKFTLEEAKIHYQKLVEKYPDHLEVYKTFANVLFDDYVNNDKEESKGLVLQVAKAMIDKIDQEKLAQYFGTERLQKDTSEKNKNKHKKMENEREILQLAYRLEAFANKDKQSFENLTKWTADQSKDGFYVYLQALLLSRDQLYGQALSIVNKYLEQPNPKQKKQILMVSDLKIDLLQKLGWQLWADYEQKWKAVKNQDDFKPF
ncbi:subtilase family-domain-containing protein [Gorgonomyces haynaldii]|nr:subtilase family-domain-containing protein [Gorgonomyces haynaldii]